MTVVLTLLLINGVIGAVDTLWYHEYTVRMAWHPEQFATELRLHSCRDGVYAVVYGTIGWLRWNGMWGYVLAALLATEIVVTMADFVVEDRTRTLSAGERVLHSTMAIVYGAMLARFIPILVARAGESTGLRTGPLDVPSWMAVTASLFGAGIALSGARDAWAAGHHGGRPFVIHSTS